VWHDLRARMRQSMLEEAVDLREREPPRVALSEKSRKIHGESEGLPNREVCKIF
jgi:hypothetical protein